MMKRINAIIVILAAVVSLCGCDSGSEDINLLPPPTESSSETSFSAYDYYSENSEKIVSVEDAASYQNTLTASEALDIAVSRGFDQSALTYDLDITGKYLGTKEAEKGSEEKAPMYLTTYITENESVWYIYIVSDSITAYPVSYIHNNGIANEIIISERDELICYDDQENKYYVTVPKASVVKLVVEDEINAEMLEKYTEEELSKL